MAAQVLVVSGLAQVSDSLQLQVSLSPPFSQPGMHLQLQAILTNVDTQTAAPEVIFQLPAGLALADGLLPAGVTVNVQSRSLTWLPVVASGGVAQISLPLRLETADVQNPEQAITAILKFNNAEETISAPFWAGIPPLINGILSPPQVSVGQPFQLRAELSGAGPFSQVWDLGDGRVLKVIDPVILFSQPGQYEVKLEASNPIGTVSQTRLITVVPHPAAQFTLDDMTPGVGQTVTFISQSGGAQPLQYAWDFGDGVTSTEASPQHQYNGLGTYQVHLRVWNQYGQSDAFWSVTVGPLPGADMIAPESVLAGQRFQLQGVGDASVQRFEWDMGDGRYHEGATINHLYTHTGDYYITMIAVNEFGATQMGRWIHVDPGLLQFYLPMIVNGGGAGVTAVAEDPLTGLDLPPVELAQPFILAPLEIAPGTLPAEQLFAYINEARRQFGRSPLSNVSSLNAAAQNHAADMAAYGYTAHTGSDGSVPAERFIWYGYTSGYAGETTAWGFEEARQAVEFWVNSPSHRAILLNEAATDVGVGYSADFNAPNVWYWSAEFGNAFAARPVPAVRLQEPAQNTEAMVATAVTYAWNWPVALTGNQHFVLYLHTQQGSFPVAELYQPTHGTYFAVQLTADSFTSGSSRLQVLPGRYEWQVKLEDGNVLAEGERRSIAFREDPNAPTVTPTPTETGTAVPPTPTVPTATPTLAWPTDTPPPPPPTEPPPLVTGTPSP
jgi:PKD repeat protein